MATITLAEIIAKNKERFEKMKFEMSDQNALAFHMIFPVWAECSEYIAGERVRYNDVLYRVLVDHTAQAGMEPDVDTEKFEQVKVK